ncbi:MAG TPA: ABC transporter permease [Candidatus Methylomirabilis sp.]|nr:ABC transporter permease [Candidatus Methylomirabilis sp.]
MSWVRRIFSRRRIYGDLSEEMRSHLEEKIEELVAHGMSRKEAAHAARREFGNVTLIEGDSRDTWRWVSLENIAADFRFGLRLLAKSPGASLTAILILGLGLSISVAIFAFVDATLIQPLPYTNPSRLVSVYESAQAFPRSNLSFLDYLDWKKQNTVFSSLEAWTGSGVLLTTNSGVKPIPSIRVTDGFFRTLGVNPILGRDFVAGEDLQQAAPVALLSYAGWQKWFGGRQDVVGQTVALSGVPTTIIGVLPKEFHFALRGNATFWQNLRADSHCEKSRGCHNLYGVARLKDGVSLQAASAEMKGIAKQLEAQYPDSNRGQGAAIITLSEAIVGPVRPILFVLLAAAGLLLLIACVNVSSLLLVRSEIRRREIAVRLAIGASRPRLFVQFVTEGFLLVIAGSVLGLFCAEWAMHLLVGLIPAQLLVYLPYLSGLGLNARVLTFAAVLAVLAAFVFALVPNLRLSVRDMQDGLSEGSRGSAGKTWSRLGSKLVVAELAIAMVLLVAAGLLGKSLYRLLRVDLGFQPDHLAMLDLAAADAKYAKQEQQTLLARQLIERISRIPGVESVGLTSTLVLNGNGNTTWIRIVGRPYHGEHNEVNERDVSAGYFQTLHARLLRGRFFTDADDFTKPRVVIINQALAKQYFPGEDPIGKKIGGADLSPGSIMEIVGVVDSIREASLDEQIWPGVYEPFNQNGDTFFSVIVRTVQNEQAILPTLDSTIREMDPGIGTMAETTMNLRIDESPSAYLHRSSAWLVGGFAALAFFLSVVGLYGVVAYSVSQRTREIGVRMALGAQRSSVYELVLREAGLLAVSGVFVGLICSVAAAALMRDLLFGVSSWDVPTLMAVSATLAAAALLASYIPARRATRVDPVIALRHE